MNDKNQHPNNNLDAPGTPRKRQAVVGYLEGRGLPGVTLGPEACITQIGERATLLKGRVEALRAEIEAVDRGLAAVGRALKVSQPPMWKRVEVRWWLDDGVRLPVLVRARPGPGGRLTVDRIRRAGIKLRTDRGFGLNADLAKRAFFLFWRLRKRRDDLVGLLANAERALAKARWDRLETGREMLDAWVTEAADIEREAKDRLRQVGYDIPVDEPEAEEEPLA